MQKPSKHSTNVQQPKKGILIMKVIEKKAKAKTLFPMRVSCEVCGAELEVGETDMKYGEYGLGYIRCPVCGDSIYFDGIEMKVTPDNMLYPKHFKSFERGVPLSQEETQIYARAVYKVLLNSDLSVDYAYTSVGDTAVIGVKNAAKIEIFVAKKYDDFYVYIGEDK